LLACIPLFSVACSTQEKRLDNEFLIEGKISGIEDGIVIRLYRWDGDAGTPIATDTVRNGRFIFKEETESDMEWLSIDPSGEGFASMLLGVWVAPKTRIKIKGKGKLHILWEVTSSIPYQKEENRYKNNSREIIAESARLSLESDDLRKKARTASSEDDALAYRNKADSLGEVRKLLRIKQLHDDIDIMKQTNISPVWLSKMRGVTQMLMYGRLDNESDNDLRNKAVELYDKIPEEDKNTPLGSLITSQLFPPQLIKVGDDMADADFFDINGNTKHISDYLGKFLLLDFWSIGCGPCLMAFPEMKEVSEIYRENLTIISISLDRDNSWKEAMGKHDMPWVNIRDPKSQSGLYASYGARGIPYYVIISPEGKVIDQWFGFFDGFIKRKVGETVK